MEKAYYLDIAEFCLLVLQKKMEGVTFFSEISSYALDDQSLAQAVVSLVDKGLLSYADAHTYHLEQSLADAMKVLESAESTLVLQGQLHKMPMQCMYRKGEASLSLQMDEVYKNKIRVSVQPFRDAVLSIAANDFMPEQNSVFLDKQEMELEKMGSYFFEPLQEIVKREEVLLAADYLPRGLGEKKKRICVISDSKADRILCLEEGKCKVLCYTQDGLYKVFAGLEGE